MKETVFYLVQAAFWGFLVIGWVRAAKVCRAVRRWFSRGGLACASLALGLTAAMSIYVRVGQQKPFDVWESRYLFYTTTSGLLGAALSMFGAGLARWVGLSVSVFALFIALADAASL